MPGGRRVVPRIGMNGKINHPFLFILAFIVFCYAVVKSGYYGDDSLNSFIESIMAEKGFGFVDQYAHNFRTFLPGRLSILQFYHWVFLLFSSLIVYKIYVCAVVCVALLSTYLVSKAIVKEPHLPFLIIVFTVLIGIQFREYGDSVLVFHGATSLSLILLNASILLFIKFLEFKKGLWIVASLIFFTIGCLTYELVYPFFLIFFLISVGLGRLTVKHALRYLWLFLAPVAILTLPNILSRVLVQTPAIGSDPNYHKAYEFSLNLAGIAQTLGKEIVSSLPLSNLLINPFSSFSINSLVLISDAWILLLAVLTGLFGMVFYLALKAVKTQRTGDAATPRPNQFLLAAYALMLLVIPNGIIALSPKYQTEIVWGSGYVSLYFGYFGMGILASMALCAVVKRYSSTWPLLVFSLLLGTGAAANFAANNKTVEVLNSFWKNPRTVAEDALRKGIMDGVSDDNSYLFINNDYPWDTTAFIRKYSGKIFKQEQNTGTDGRFLGANVNLASAGLSGNSKANLDFSPKAFGVLGNYLKYELGGNYYFEIGNDRRAYYFDYYADSDTSGYALLAMVRNIFVSNANINGLASNRVRIYLRTPPRRGVYSTMSATFITLDPDTLRPNKSVTIQENEFDVIAQGIGWKLIEINSDLTTSLIDVKSVRMNTSQKAYQTSSFPSSLIDKQLLQFKVDPKLEVVHLGLSRPFNNSYIAFNPVKLGNEFSVVLRVRLGESGLNVPYSHILGNHPGKNNFEGFVIQKSPAGQNVFDLNFGNGKAWTHVVAFKLDSARDTFLAISVKDGKGVALVDKAESAFQLEGFRDSEMPLYIGNYIGKDRPFQGQVSELLITKTALSREVLLELQNGKARN